jgi:hypothetical protein
MSQKVTSKPIKDFHAGNIQASIWKQDIVKDGRTRIRHLVRFQKHFRKDDNHYKKTSYYFRDDLPRLILVVQKAFEFIALSKSKDTEESVPV